AGGEHCAGVGLEGGRLFVVRVGRRPLAVAVALEEFLGEFQHNGRSGIRLGHGQLRISRQSSSNPGTLDRISRSFLIARRYRLPAPALERPSTPAVSLAESWSEGLRTSTSGSSGARGASGSWRV